MKLQQVSNRCLAVLNERNRACDANSGIVNRGGGVVIDTLSDLPHARQMIRLFGKVWPETPNRVINAHEAGDHVWGNQRFEGAEIIAHRSVRALMPKGNAEEFSVSRAGQDAPPFSSASALENAGTRRSHRRVPC